MTLARLSPPPPSRDEQAAADRRRLEMFQQQMRGREKLRQQLEDELRAMAVTGAPLTSEQVERLTSRLAHQPKTKNQHNKEKAHSTSSAGAVIATSASPAIRHLFTDIDRFLKRCSSVIGALFRACELGLAEMGTMMEHQRLVHRDSLASLDGRKLVARAEALLKSPIDSVKARAGLERRGRQLKEMNALLRRLLLYLDGSSADWLELSEGIDAAMRDDCGVYINRTVLSAHDAEYQGFSRGSVQGVDDNRRLLGGLRQRVMSRALSSALSNDDTLKSATDPDIGDSGERSLDEEGVVFTDTVIEKLRARLAKISIENGRSPNFSVYDGSKAKFGEMSDIAEPSGALPTPDVADGGSADVSFEEVDEHGARIYHSDPLIPPGEEPPKSAAEIVGDDSVLLIPPMFPSDAEDYSGVSLVAELPSAQSSNSLPALMDSEETSLSSQPSAISIKERLRARLNRQE